MSRERFDAALRIIRANNPVLADWLRNGFDRYQSGVDLDEALELTQRHARDRRDAYLRRAAELVPGSDWQKAKKLARWIAWFEAGNVEDSELSAAIARARGVGLPMPASAKQIKRIISGT